MLPAVTLYPDSKQGTRVWGTKVSLAIDIPKQSQKAFFLRLCYFCHTLLQKLGYMQMNNLSLIICFNFWYRHRPSRNGICISEAGHSSHQGGGNDISLQAIHLLVWNATDNWFIINTREGTNRCEGKEGQNTSVLVLSFKLSEAVQIKLIISLLPGGSSCRLAIWIYSFNKISKDSTLMHDFF